MERDFDETMQFARPTDQPQTPEEILRSVCIAMRDKGYDPINQLVGYLTSGDPTYITSHQHARYLIRKLERDELLEELIRNYVNQMEEE